MKAGELRMQQGFNLNKLNQIRKQNIPNGPDTHKGNAVNGTDFANLLQKQMDQSGAVQFSTHAMRRVEERGLNVSMDNMQRLNSGVLQAEQKGSKNSLILVDENAFVVNVSNRTVITALDKSQSSGNVFTNIDSVAIM